MIQERETGRKWSWHILLYYHSIFKSKAAWTTETSVSCPNTTQRQNPEDLDLNLHRRENLKTRTTAFFS